MRRLSLSIISFSLSVKELRYVIPGFFRSRITLFGQRQQPALESTTLAVLATQPLVHQWVVRYKMLKLLAVSGWDIYTLRRLALQSTVTRRS
jgi:hypothetical protein